MPHQSISFWLVIILFIPVKAVACPDPGKALAAISFAAPSTDLIPEKIENEIVECLRVGTLAYLKELDGVSFLSFKNKSIPPDTAVALTEEARDVAKVMRAMLKTVDVIKNTPYAKRLPAWTHVAREISITVAEISDLEDRKLIQSQWGTGLRIFLPSLFDNFIYPRLVPCLAPSETATTM